MPTVINRSQVKRLLLEETNAARDVLLGGFKHTRKTSVSAASLEEVEAAVHKAVNSIALREARSKKKTV